MNKLVQTLFFVLTVTCPLIAQSDLSPEQQKQFDERSLSVLLPGFGDPAHRWTGFQNHRDLSEPSFYEIAGFPEEAKQAKAHRTNSILYILLGGAGEMLGGVVMGTSVHHSGPLMEYEDINETQFMVGLVIGVASTIPGVIGLLNMTTTWSSVDQAKAAAEGFNFKLRQELIAGDTGAGREQ